MLSPARVASAPGENPTGNGCSGRQPVVQKDRGNPGPGHQARGETERRLGRADHVRSAVQVEQGPGAGRDVRDDTQRGTPAERRLGATPLRCATAPGPRPARGLRPTSPRTRTATSPACSRSAGYRRHRGRRGGLGEQAALRPAVLQRRRGPDPPGHCGDARGDRGFLGRPGSRHPRGRAGPLPGLLSRGRPRQSRRGDHVAGGPAAESPTLGRAIQNWR